MNIEALADQIATRDRSKDAWKDAAPIRALAKAARAQRDASDALDTAVRWAREAGASWGTIGDALGVSRQAAQQKYGAPAKR
ncbi:MAG: hypothetical protein U0V73_09295 [Acidimicrobiia bacterium]